MTTNGHRGRDWPAYAATRRPVPSPVREEGACLHTLFEARVAATPEAVALAFAGSPISYGALNMRANRLARHLRRIGIGPDDRVAICLDRSPEMVIGLLAILKAGGAYVPLDPTDSSRRLQHILDDCAPKAILTHGPAWNGLAAALPDSARAPALIDFDDPQRWGGYSGANLDPLAVGITSCSLAYVLYANDGAGVPRGVMVEHRNVTRLFSATAPWFRFGPSDVWTLFHAPTVDLSVWELWGALLHGGKAVVIPQATIDSPRDFYALLCREGVTILNQTPSSFQQLIAVQASSPLRHALRSVILAGEDLDTARLLPWALDLRNARTELASMYGTAETIVHAACHLTRIGEQACPAIGQPVPDSRVHVLDADRSPVPIGGLGEIYVGGAGIARGYLNCPDLTLERFMASPFVAGDRLYRTGTLGRPLPDGMIEFVGSMAGAR